MSTNNTKDGETTLPSIAENLPPIERQPDEIGSLGGGGGDDDDTGSKASVGSSQSSVVGSVKETLKQSLKILVGENPYSPHNSNDEDEIRHMNIDTSTTTSQQQDVSFLTSPGGDDDDDNEKENRDIEKSKTKSITFEEEEDEEEYFRPPPAEARMSLLDAPVQHSKRVGLTEIDFLQDSPKEMTLSRRIAISLIDKENKLYYPRNEDEDDKPLNPTNHDIDDDPDAVQEDNVNAPAPEELDSPKSQQSQGSMNMLSDRLRLSDTSKPCLKKAWAYFEHVTLPRYLVPVDEEGEGDGNQKKWYSSFCKGNKSLDRAEQGEAYIPTKLYHPITTPLTQMGDFGLGIGLYFSTLRNLVFMMISAGCISIGSLMYFKSYDYSLEQQGLSSSALLYGSAVCTNEVWRACPNCTIDDWDQNQRRIATTNSSDVADGELVFALQNDCEGVTFTNAFINYGAIFFVIISVLFLNKFQEKQTVIFDEDEQTAQDYSVEIRNPPKDAFDPEEWKQFFESGAFGDNVHVTTCTVGVDNDILVSTLLERREVLRKLELSVPPKTSMDIRNLARIAAKEERERKFFKRLLAMVVPGIPELVGRLVVLTAKVQGLSQLNYPTSHVYLTFETEAAQRTVLTALSVGSLTSKHNKTSAIKNTNHLFRGNKVLAVYEPDEPSTIRWQDLNVKFKKRMKQLVTTFLAAIAATALAAVAVYFCNRVDVFFGAMAIAAGNSVFPEIAKFLTSFEAHSAEGSKQTSLYIKIALFRWVNTAFIFLIIKPFTGTLEDRESGLIVGIFNIFIAEIGVTNAIQLGDPMGQLKRHYLAPRQATQDAMNLFMQGTPWELAERYTNMTKILFLTLWYCSIYPAAFFMCAFALFVNYFADRFSLMRTWSRAPKLGAKISQFSRKYFFSLAIAACWFASAYFWSAFPFDNLCVNVGQAVPPAYVNTFNLTAANGDVFNNVTIDEGDYTYRYCLQDLLRTEGPTFPFLPEFQPEGGEWMTSEQETVTTVFGWTCVGVMACIVFNFFLGWYSQFKTNFKSDYEAVGKDQKINFSEVEAINTYVPQVNSTMFSYPLLACNFDGIDPALLDWTDPDKPHLYYDLTKDCDELLEGIQVSARHVFSKIQHWPPNSEVGGDGGDVEP